MADPSPRKWYNCGHFLSKFNNENEEHSPQALGVAAPLGADEYLLLIKKFSGSLFAVHPHLGVTSKNSANNIYRDVAAHLIHRYLEVVGLAAADVYRWCTDTGTTICGEVVVPDYLGEHGARPETAFFVVTSAARDGRILSYPEMLAVATRWRLPIAEGIVVDHVAAAAVESRVHAWRFAGFDDDFHTVYADHADHVTPIATFLSHKALQGSDRPDGRSILEGLVSMRMRGDVALVASRLRAYTEAVAPHLAGIMALFQAQGRIIAEPGFEASATKLIAENQLNVERDVSPDTDAGRLLHHLRQVYAGKGMIRCPVYRIDEHNLAAMIYVGKDGVFYDHAMFPGLPPLYRCHSVCTIPPPSPIATTSHDAVVAVAKLKCGEYIKRTFGIRNKLPVASVAAHMVSYDRFMETWGVPKDLRPVWRTGARAWAEYACGRDIVSNDYLKHVHLLADRPPKQLPPHAVYVCNFSNKEISPGDYFPDHAPSAGKDLHPGCYQVGATPPNLNAVQAPERTLLIVVPPEAGCKDVRRQKTYDKFSAERYAPMIPTALDGVAGARADFPTGRELKLARPAVSVTVVLCVPPGGLKTTMLAAMYPDAPSMTKLTKPDAGDSPLIVINSDEVKALDKNPDDLFKAAVASGRYQHIVYDKNVPDLNKGLAKIVRLCGQAHVRFHLIVPETLPDRAVCLERVRARPVMQFDTVDAMAAFDSIHAACATSLKAAQRIPGATIVPFDPAAWVAPSTAIFIDDLPTATADYRSANYCCLEIYVNSHRTACHMTLFPPGVRIPQGYRDAEGRIVDVDVTSFHRLSRGDDVIYYWMATTNKLVGLADNPLQRAIWHITANLSGTNTLKGKAVADHLRGDVVGWTSETINTDRHTVTGRLSIATC